MLVYFKCDIFHRMRVLCLLSDDTIQNGLDFKKVLMNCDAKVAQNPSDERTTKKHDQQLHNDLKQMNWSRWSGDEIYEMSRLNNRPDPFWLSPNLIKRRLAMLSLGCAGSERKCCNSSWMQQKVCFEFMLKVERTLFLGCGRQTSENKKWNKTFGRTVAFVHSFRFGNEKEKSSICNLKERMKSPNSELTFFKNASH